MPSIFNTVRDLGRLREITGVLVRHGFGDFVQRAGLNSLVPLRKKDSDQPQLSFAARLRCVLQELGPSFIKLGQIASTRPDLLPEDVIVELRRLQDDVEPMPFDRMREVIESQLGRELNEVFSHIDESPLASASIGQVYRARLRQAEAPEAEVVVKVQRPDIAATVERDADLLYLLAHGIERSFPELQVYAPVRLAQEFDRTMRAELDYVQEADNADRFRENFADADEVRFPRVYREASTHRVLTLEYLDGLNVFDAVAQGASGEFIAKRAIKVIVEMIFEHGFFHADPHPGNLLILGPLSEPVLGLIDLGQIGRLGPRARDGLIALVMAIGRRDVRAISSAIYHLGTVTKKLDRAAFEAHISDLVDRYLGRRLGDIDASAVLRDLLGGAMRFGIEMPPDLAIMGKSLVTVEGIARQIYPELDVAAELQPYMTKMVGLRYSPERMLSDAVHLAQQITAVTAHFPERAEDILEDLRQGRLRIETRQPQVMEGLDRASRRLNGGLVEAALILGGSALIATDKLAWGLALFAGALLTYVVTGTLMLMSRGRRQD